MIFLLAFLLAACAPAPVPSDTLPTPPQEGGPAHLVPEHGRTLSELFLLDSRRYNMEDIVGSIVAATPDYTQVNFISTADAVPDFVARRSHRLIPDALPRTARSTPQFWAQDVFQVVTRADQSRKIVLPAGEHFQPEADAILQELGYETMTSTLHWEGGNMVTDVVNGRSVLYIGYTIYEGQSDRAENPGIPVEAVQRVLAEEFEVDEVVPIPYVTGNLFHLDQIFMITAPGEVVVHSVDLAGAAERIRDYLREQNGYFFQVFVEGSGAQIPPESWDEAYLAALPQLQPYAMQHAQKMHDRLNDVATLFADRGYTVHRLPADPRLLWDSLSLVNGIPYIDRQTREKVVLLPEYTHHKRADFHDMHAAWELFTTLGFSVRFVPVLTSSGAGGPHCLSNVGG